MIPAKTLLRALGLSTATFVCMAGCVAPASTDSSTASEPRKPLRFGLLTDVQYADKPTEGKRRYRDGLVNLEQCIADLNTQDLAFAVHCGDIIDGRESAAETSADLTLVLDAFSKLNAPMHHVIGNHCLSVPRDELMQRLELSRNYESFVHADWRFIIVDALAFSTCGLAPEDPELTRATDWMEANGGKQQPNVRPWNGGLGEEQRSWLQAELALATAAGQHAVVFSHLPVLAESSTRNHLLWDHEDVLAILDHAPSFSAWINGHDHAGGYAERNQRTFLTLPAMVNADPAANAYAIVDVHPERLEIQGVGDVQSRTIWAAGAAAVN